MAPRLELRYVPLEEATASPGMGFWEVIADSWWSHVPGKGLIFYGKSPQCNRNESISRMITSKHYPDAEVLFVPRVYVRHDCADYR